MKELIGSAERCGHNFPPKECPYAHCGYRAASERLGKLEEENEGWRHRCNELTDANIALLMRLEKIESTEQLAKDTYREMRGRLTKCEAALRLYLEHFGDPLKCIRAALEE